jgi:hypothetical protein
LLGNHKESPFSEPSYAIAVKRMCLSTFSTHAMDQIWFGMKLALNSLGLTRHRMKPRLGLPIWHGTRYPAQSAESFPFRSVTKPIATFSGLRLIEVAILAD